MPEAPRSPERKLLRIPDAPRDLKGALRLASWTAANVARGNLHPNEARAITAALKEFRELLGVRDADEKLAAAKAALAEMKALRASPPEAK